MRNTGIASLHPQSKTTELTACGFCGRLLGIGYYFTCHVCGATYCYIHQSKHLRAHKLHVTMSYDSP